MSDLACHIEHTLLRPNSTAEDVDRICDEAVRYQTYAVCVFPYYVTKARESLTGSGVRVTTVVAFPFGCTFTATKEDEIRRAAGNGAHEVDIVTNISQVKSGSFEQLGEEIERLNRVGQDLGLGTKFIVETAYLTEYELHGIVTIANRVRPDFVKTSTGYAPRGATPEDVRFLRLGLEQSVGIKAAGGIRTYTHARALLDAGASRLGSSSSVDIPESAPS